VPPLSLSIAHVNLRSMSDLRIEFETGKSAMADLKAALDEALRREFPGGMLQRRWEGDVLHLSGPGAKGTIEFQAGRLVGSAQLSPPASMMRSMIEQKIGAALKSVV
jgi:hypothetical protein